MLEWVVRPGLWVQGRMKSPKPNYHNFVLPGLFLIRNQLIQVIMENNQMVIFFQKIFWRINQNISSIVTLLIHTNHIFTQY
jgi:hypothetical protein